MSGTVAPRKHHQNCEKHVFDPKKLPEKNRRRKMKGRESSETRFRRVLWRLELISWGLGDFAEPRLPRRVMFIETPLETHIIVAGTLAMLRLR